MARDRGLVVGIIVGRCSGSVSAGAEGLRKEFLLFLLENYSD
jgi:hypothetical protein